MEVGASGPWPSYFNKLSTDRIFVIENLILSVTWSPNPSAWFLLPLALGSKMALAILLSTGTSLVVALDIYNASLVTIQCSAGM